MYIVEITKRQAMTKISFKIFSELEAGEVDTLDDDSPDGKKELVDCLNQAVRKSNCYAVPLTDTAKEYLIGRALPNMIDIARDNLDGRLASAATKFRDRLIRGMTTNESATPAPKLKKKVATSTTSKT
jgi:hypothetical protein